MRNENEASTLQMVWFSTGNIANNLMFVMVSTFMMFFFTSVMGLDTVVAGALFMVARLVDAFTDPLMGIIADRTNSKRFGKYRGFIHFGAPLLGVVFVCLFTVPDLDMGGKIIYAYLIYIAYSLCWTVVQVPQLTIPIIMSNNVANRAKIQAIFQGVGSLAIAFLTPLTYGLLEFFGGPNGKTDPAAWNKTAIVIAVVATILFEFSTLAVRKLDIYIPKPVVKEQPGVPKKTLKERMAFLSGNVALFTLLISFGTDMFANQFVAQTTTYFFVFNMKGNTELQSMMAMVTLPVSLALIFVARPLVVRFGKKKLICFFEAANIVTNLILMIGGAKVYLVVLHGLLSGVCMGVSNMMCRSSLLDVASYTKWKTGVDAGGLFSSTFTFVNKLCQAVSAFVTGWMLKLIAFNPQAQAQTSGAEQGLLILRCLLPILAFAATLIAMKWYPINKKVEIELQQAMNEMRKKEREALEELRKKEKVAE